MLKNSTWGVLVGLLTWSWTPDAGACGGCFAPAESQDSFVTGHRMAFAVSEDRTVLWDQFEYTGNPADFSWVLPVRPGAFVEVASPAWLDALDAVTKPRIFSPAVNCGGGGGGFSCGCAADDASDGFGGFYDAPPVQVVSQATVGPYETVILRSREGDALSSWLAQNGYAIAPNIEPVIQAYVSEGFDFLALKLRPGFGVNQMEPVRVTTPNGPSELPLRMVAAGAGNEVDMTLFVLGEGRQAIVDLIDFEIENDDLVYDFGTDTSDYGGVAEGIFEKAGGRVHITSYAQPNPFLREQETPQGTVLTFGGADERLDDDRLDGIGGVGFASSEESRTLDELYFRLAFQEEGYTQTVGENPCLWRRRPYDSTNRISPRCGDAPCPSEEIWPEPGAPVGQGGASGNDATAGGAGGLTAGGAGSTGGSGGAPLQAYPPNSSGHFVCGPFTDVESAMIGQVPSRVWLTRLDMRLPRSALTMDCPVGPSSMGPVSNVLTPTGIANHPCPANASASAAEPLFPTPPGWLVGVGLALAAALRRRRRSQVELIRS